MATFDASDIVDELEDDFNKLMRKTANDIALSVVPISPEDTGRFKGNWNASIDGIGDDYDANEFDTGSAIGTVADVTRQASSFDINKNKELSIYNNVADSPNNYYAETVTYDLSGSVAEDLIDVATSEALRTLDGR